MQDLEVTLPGGLLDNGELERKVSFKPITGRTELALTELNQNTDAISYVSSVLMLVLERVGSNAADARMVNELCMADRQFLMLRLAAILNGEQVWLKVHCAGCNAPFDVEFKRGELPVKEAGENFPSAILKLRTMEFQVRVPTALDQMATRNMSESEAMGELLQRCLRKINGNPVDDALIRSLSDHDITAIDQELDRLSPAVCNELLVTCPECGREQNTILNHYILEGLIGSSLYDEIHTIALHYHWSEEEILNLPRFRRYKYLTMIDRTRSMVGQVK